MEVLRDQESLCELGPILTVFFIYSRMPGLQIVVGAGTR